MKGLGGEEGDEGEEKEKEVVEGESERGREGGGRGNK
jgi:hypothetical protein